MLDLEPAGKAIIEGKFFVVLRDFAYMMRKGLTDDEGRWLRNWLWFAKRAGPEGVDRLKNTLKKNVRSHNATSPKNKLF